LGGGALKRGHGAPFERLAQLGDALGGVGAIAITIDAAELVVGQTAMGKEACQCPLTHSRTHFLPSLHVPTRVNERAYIK
jgi:hypothetical protein